MALLNPFALLWALTIGLILLLHFRKPKRIRYISNLQLWQTPATESSNRRPILERIKRNWLLILQILFLAFVVLALARPSLVFWGKSRTVVLVIDCSASMGAREHGKTRIDLAREKALKLLNQVGRNDRVLLVEGKAQPVLISDRDSVRSTLDRLSATEPSADMEQALMMGLSSVSKTESYEAFVFSDGTQEIRLPANNDRVHYIQVGESGNNVAITRLSIRSNPFSPYDRDIYAEVANFSDLTQKFRFDLSLEQSPLISEIVELGTGQRKSFVAKAPPEGSGVVKASIDAKDDLDADNRAQAVFDLRRISVLLVTAGNQFLQKALEVNPRIDCTILKREEWVPGKAYDVVILDGVVPTQLPKSNYFRIEYGSGAAVKDLISPTPRHPVLSLLSLRNIAVEEARPLKVESSETVLLEGKGMPLMTASENGAFRTVRLGFDVRASNLPLSLSFPVLISNVVNWLGIRNDDSVSQFSEQESRIKPIFKPRSVDQHFSGKPVLSRTGWEIWRPLLFIALALLILEFIA